MKRTLVFIFIMIALLVIPCAVQAAVAYPGVVEVLDEASGQTIEIRNHGDEFFSCTTDLDGNLLVKDQDGAFRYVVVDGDAFAMGDTVVRNPFSRSIPSGATKVNLNANLAGWKEKLRDLQSSSHSASRPRRGASYTPALIPVTYDFANDPLKNHIVTLNYADIPVFTYPDSVCPLLVLKLDFSDILSLFDDSKLAKNLVQKISEYYQVESNGKFTYVPAQETSGTPDDGVISVSLPIARPLFTSAAYGPQNTGSGAYAGLYSAQDGSGNEYAIFNDSSLFAYAVQAASPSIDFARYDQNRDGFISPIELAVSVIVAGYDASIRGEMSNLNKPSTWAHSSYFNFQNEYKAVLADGVKLYKYTMLGENMNPWYDYQNPALGPTPLLCMHGTACHELGHDLGLMDLYDTTYSNLSQDVGALSLMSSGNWGARPGETLGSTPTSLDPYAKSFLGFYEETPVLKSGDYLSYQSASPKQYNILSMDTANPNLYYLIENRQFTGHDAGMLSYHNEPGGVVIWRIDKSAIRKYWAYNTLNAHEGDYGIMPVFLLQPNGNQTPFLSSQTLRPSQVFTAQRSPLITITAPSAPGARMTARISIEGTDPTATPTVSPTPTISSSPPPTSAPTPTPTPSIQPTPAPQKTPPATGDSAQPLLWLALALLSGMLALGFGARRRAMRKSGR